MVIYSTYLTSWGKLYIFSWKY